MKKTVYFSGETDHPQRIDKAILLATNKRADFLLKNQENIAEICGEELITIPWHQASHLTIVIQLSHFGKK